MGCWWVLVVLLVLCFSHTPSSSPVQPPPGHKRMGNKIRVSFTHAKLRKLALRTNNQKHGGKKGQELSCLLEEEEEGGGGIRPTGL